MSSTTTNLEFAVKLEPGLFFPASLRLADAVFGQCKGLEVKQKSGRRRLSFSL